MEKIFKVLSSIYCVFLSSVLKTWRWFVGSSTNRSKHRNFVRITWISRNFLRKSLFIVGKIDADKEKCRFARKIARGKPALQWARANLFTQSEKSLQTVSIVSLEIVETSPILFRSEIIRQPITLPNSSFALCAANKFVWWKNIFKLFWLRFFPSRSLNQLTCIDSYGLVYNKCNYCWRKLAIFLQLKYNL